MMHKHDFAALDGILQDIRGNTQLMGGMTLMMAGDFRQALHNVSRGTPAGQLKASYQWPNIEKITLTTNVPYSAANKLYILTPNGRTANIVYPKALYLMHSSQEQESDTTKKGQENSTEENRIGQEGERRKSYSAAVIDGIKRNTTIYVGYSIIRKTDTRLSKGEDVVVCLPGARIEHVTERVEKIVGRENGGTILIHVGTNNTDKEGTTAIVDTYRKLLKKMKQARLGQIILSGILPVCGNRIQGYRNSKRMAVNGMVERLCKEEDVGYVDMWDSFVGNEELYFRDGLHLSGKGAAVLAEGLSGAVASGLGKVRYLN